jgi:hypothetical protein
MLPPLKPDGPLGPIERPVKPDDGALGADGGALGIDWRLHWPGCDERGAEGTGWPARGAGCMARGAPPCRPGAFPRGLGGFITVGFCP